MKFLLKRNTKMTTMPSDLPLTDVKIFNTFDDMDLPTNLLRGIYAHGFEKPSEIQKRGIVPIKNGNDLLAQAQSCTGKTGTFCVGALTKIDPSLMKPQVLVIVPTRELAQQIEKVAQALGAYMELKTYSATGGTPIRDDLRALERGLHFIVGTPGRIFDLMNRGQLNRQYIRVLVLDEADQMLEDRFKEQILCILQMGFPKQTQVALFSATMPAEVIEVANKLLREPVRILIPPEEVTLEGISQYCVMLQKEEWKFDALCDIYKQLTVNQAIIYCNKRQRAEWLAEKMMAEGFPLSYIHGEMEVDERRNRMQAFRSGNVRVLISTDLLARGIDVQQVSLVINFELPPQRENYIHRIGRSGRYGRKGTAINLISGDEVNAMKDIESHYQTIIKELPDDLANLIKN
ncbi:MAG TPA: ATP-dependent helicase [Chitinophagaceae bacterium]|nr:ATP-dependent helicase [Chitinophagaceae bacterium]